MAVFYQAARTSGNVVAIADKTERISRKLLQLAYQHPRLCQIDASIGEVNPGRSADPQCPEATTQAVETNGANRTMIGNDDYRQMVVAGSRIRASATAIVRYKNRTYTARTSSARIDVVSVPNLTPSQLAGQYTNPSEELNKRVTPMGSEKLFVFPDGSYIFTIVSDIAPDTISDKGTWSLNGDTLELQSDKDVKWKSKHVERQHLVVRRRGHNDELFPVGIGWHLSCFEKNAKRDPEFQFLLDSLKREKAITAEEAGPLRKRLMKEKWQPEFYRSESTPSARRPVSVTVVIARDVPFTRLLAG